MGKTPKRLQPFKMTKKHNTPAKAVAKGKQQTKKGKSS